MIRRATEMSLLDILISVLAALFWTVVLGYGCNWIFDQAPGLSQAGVVWIMIAAWQFVPILINIMRAP